MDANVEVMDTGSGSDSSSSGTLSGDDGLDEESATFAYDPANDVAIVTGNDTASDGVESNRPVIEISGTLYACTVLGFRRDDCA